MEALTALRESRVFRNLSPSAMAQLSMLAKEQELGARVTLFNEGDVGNTLYLIRYGTVAILKKDRRSGAEEEVATLGSGSHFGEMALVHDDHKEKMAAALVAFVNGCAATAGINAVDAVDEDTMNAVLC